MRMTKRMNKIFVAAVTGMAIASANGAFAASEQAVSGLTPPIYSSPEPGRPAPQPASVLDYRIELIGSPQHVSGWGKMNAIDSESLVFVRLVRSSDGAPLTDADVTLSRVDMAPNGMREVTARSYIRQAGNPGTYRVEVHPAMAGRWAVTVAARVAGESEPVLRTLTVTLVR